MDVSQNNIHTLNRGLTEHKQNSLQFLPVNLFASVMGISGLALAWRWSHKLFGTYALIGELIGVLAIIIFIVLSISYITKLVKYPQKIKDEFKNPIIGNFFGTITISILLLSSIIEPYSRVFSEIVWIIGTVLTIALAFIIVHRLMNQKQEIINATPAWLLPGVGTLNIPVTGGTMPFSWSDEINLFSFAVGSVLAIVFFTLIFSRLMHHDPMPEKLTPSLMILIAPFVVGFLAYTNITKDVDMFASILFYFGLFLGIVFFWKSI